VIEATVGPAPDIGESFAGETFTLTLPKSPVVKVSTPIGSTTVVKDTTILIAKFDNRARGYQRIDFKGVSSDGTFFPDVSALVVNGKSTQLMTYVPASAGGRQNSPSVHMGYDYNKTDTAEWFYNEVTVPEGMDHTASYFMVSGFRGGYFGIQPQPSATTTNPKVRVLFSVWAPFNTDDPASIPDSLKVAIVKGGDGVKIQSFGGEGSGTQTFISTNANETPVDKQVVWKTGTTYKCFVRIFPSRNIGFTGYAATDYIAYFYDPDKSEWRLMAWLRRPYLFPRQEVPHYYEDAYSFVENFSGETGHLLRKACFGNQWIRLKNKTWKELTKGHFSVDATGGAGHRLDYGGGVTEDNKFYLQNGGFFNNNSTPGAYFNRTPTGISPDVDFAALEALLQPEWDNQLN
jgi:hypothetical protein